MRAVKGGKAVKASPEARGYGWPHRRERAKWKPVVDAGLAHCWRCGQWIDPAKPWDLGHDDHDRNVYRGPECRPCNRSTATRAARRRRQPRFLDW